MSLSLQLHDFLERNLTSTSSSSLQEVRTNNYSNKQKINLFKGIQLEDVISETKRKNSKRTFTDIFSYQLHCKMFCNKDEFRRKCRELVFEPELILSKKLAYPWAHPKNIRNVEKYKKIQSLPNGGIVAVPTEDEHSGIGKEDAHSSFVKTEAGKEDSLPSASVNIQTSPSFKKRKKKKDY